MFLLLYFILCICEGELREEIEKEAGGRTRAALSPIFTSRIFFNICFCICILVFFVYFVFFVFVFCIFLFLYFGGGPRAALSPILTSRPPSSRNMSLKPALHHFRQLLRAR